MVFAEVIRWLHVIGAAVLLGTGAGIAFFMVMAHRSGEPAAIAHVAGTVVIADTIFTATAIVLQPLSGAALAYSVGWPLTEPWILLSLLLYAVTGLCWLPVVWIQWRMRNVAREAVASNASLPPGYHKLFRAWLLLGFPAFACVLAIMWLMIARPTF